MIDKDILSRSTSLRNKSAYLVVEDSYLILFRKIEPVQQTGSVKIMIMFFYNDFIKCLLTCIEFHSTFFS